MSIKITGTGIGLPKRHVTNDELVSQFGLDTSDEWITTRTGIKGRYICEDETLTDLAATATTNALADAGIAAADLDYIIGSTVAADAHSPSLACAVAERIDATCAAVDVNGACTGFLYAIDAASALIEAGRASTILIICAEKMSAHVDWTDRRTCVLFGDGAAAVVVTRGNALKYIHLGSRPDTQVISIPNDMAGNNPIARDQVPAGFVYMDGQKVFKYAVSMIQQEINDGFANTGLGSEDIDYYLFHQANLRIIDYAITRLKQPHDKFPTNIERYGNVSSVTIPTLLHEMIHDGRIQPGQKLFLCAFGAGMTYGGAIMEWE
ncbi:MAG: beta-ketoacyl-ACP synthase 3 [Propionibacteriaceae bacterium]|jgi:3-oxoacyl-[acyl-carrier-protein] synthase-3|nr:beta-ketoacyl-ACP synthase 3 [Propionibacteriaceae bacterium]